MMLVNVYTSRRNYVENLEVGEWLRSMVDQSKGIINTGTSASFNMLKVKTEVNT